MKKLSILLSVSLFLCAFVAKSQNVGINNTNPQASLDVQGDLRFRSAILTLPNGLNNDVDLTTTKSSVYMFAGGAIAVGGCQITGFTGGVDGRIVTIFNNSTVAAIQLYDASFSVSPSAAANKILTGTGSNAVIYGNGSVTLRYDGAKAKWIVMGSAYTDGLSLVSAGSGPWTVTGNNISNNNSGNVGIKTTTPNAALDLNGDLVVGKGTITLAPTGGFFDIYNDIDIATSRFSFYEMIAPNGAFITGFTGGVDGRTISILNNTNNKWSLYEEYAQSAANNRIILGNTGYPAIYFNMVWLPKTILTFRYRASDNRWLLINRGVEPNLWLPAYGATTTGDVYTNTNVGIGTNGPTESLTINKTGIGLSQEDASKTVKVGFYTSASAAFLQTHSNHDLFFSTNDGGAQMTLKTNGNVGIGTTNPINKLQIGNPPAFSGNDIAIGNGAQGMSLFQSATASTWFSNTNFALMPAGGGTGNVGIGTNTPTQKLQVAGNVEIGDEMYSSATGGLNIVPLGVIKMNQNTAYSSANSSINYFCTNEVGNLILAQTGSFVSGADDALIFKIYLNFSITGIYNKIIVVGAPGFNNSSQSSAMYRATADIENLSVVPGNTTLGLAIRYYGDNLNNIKVSGTYMIYGIK
jgi:hypothetical protein